MMLIALLSLCYCLTNNFWRLSSDWLRISDGLMAAQSTYA